MQIAPRQPWAVDFFTFFFFLLYKESSFSAAREKGCDLEVIYGINNSCYIFSAYDKIGSLVQHKILETKVKKWNILMFRPECRFGALFSPLHCAVSQGCTLLPLIPRLNLFLGLPRQRSHSGYFAAIDVLFPLFL